jgi:hypothetical protein
MIIQMNVMSLLQHYSILVKKPKRNICHPSHLDGGTIAKAVKKAKISNA